MADDTTLTGSPAPIEIAPGGFTLQAPGLLGRVTTVAAAEHATRSDGGTHEPALVAALGRADVHLVKAFEIEARSVVRAASTADATRAGAELRTADGEPAMALRTPVLGDEVEQAVLFTDEAGVTRWVFPTARAGGLVVPTGQADAVTFLLPLESAPPPASADGADATATRGPLTKLGRRLVRVLAWATQDVIGAGALAAAAAWEATRRPYGVRRIPLFDHRPVDWDTLGGGRTLLLIHGTFSTAMDGFHLLSSAARGELAQIYGERIVAFDHPTLHHAPADNVRALLAMLPPGREFELDVITHSRGGLVARELIERHAASSANGAGRLRVRRAIFVAAPHRGTVLTDTMHGIAMLDRYTNLLTALPDEPFTMAMEGLFMMAKLLYHGAARALPGLRSMYPAGDYLRDLNAGESGDVRYHAISADYKPAGSSLLGRFGWAAADAAVDGIFGEPNDGVVPTAGAYDTHASAAGFPIAADRRLVLGHERRVHHCNYFGDTGVTDQIVRWLGARD